MNTNISDLLGSDIEAAGFEKAVNPSAPCTAGERTERPESNSRLRNVPAVADKSSAGTSLQSKVQGLKSKVERPRTLNPTQFLNRAACRDFILEFAGKNRAHKWNRVSEETLVKLNEIVRAAIVGHVKVAPSRGKTL